MDATVTKLWSKTSLLLWPQELMLVSYPVADLPKILGAVASKLDGFSAIVVERDEVSLTMGRTAWESIETAPTAAAMDGPYRAITFDLPIDLGVCGYLLPAAERLAKAGISIVPQCAYQKDHLLIRSQNAERAMAVLGQFIEEARASVAHGLVPDQLEIYRSQADQYDLLVSREDYQQNLLPALQKIIPLDGSTVVEFGAGTGRLTCLLAPLVKFIHAFDRSQHMLDVATAKLQNGGLQNWRVAACDNRQLSVEDEVADVAISGWSVCYLVEGDAETWQGEVSKALTEMRRVTRPGGMLILVETLGTGCELPEPPVSLAPYYEYLEANGFQRAWIRTDYLFRDRAEAETLTRFFFGETMMEKIRGDEQGIILPECTGIWWLKECP